jgi:peptidoglycan/LPS O-acetylase OafA/YrhL
MFDDAGQRRVGLRIVTFGPIPATGRWYVLVVFSPRLAYRPELDGLRGVAIALVVLFHFGQLPANAGRVGVTMFFVLSGYLITSLLLAEHRRDGRIALRAFYLRRVRRLLPALLTLVLVVFVAEVFTGRLSRAMPGIIGATFYIANWMASSGFDLRRLTHTWSLAVEEQFYVWWPAVLIALLAWRPRWAYAMALGGGLLVAFLGALGVRLPIDRADPLLFGCALAFVGRLPWPNWLFTIGAVLLALLTIMPIAPNQVVPGLLPVIGGASALLLTGVVGGSALNAVLKWGPLMWLGRISYSLYLWHFPVAYGSAYPKPIGLLLSFVLACVSYYVIEAKFRRPRQRPAAPTEPRLAVVEIPVAGGAVEQEPLARPLVEASTPHARRRAGFRATQPEPIEEA